MTGPTRSRAGRTTARLLLLGGAGVVLLLVATLPNWLTQNYGSDGAGHLAQRGSAVLPGLVALAVVAAAGLIAVFAAGRLLARFIGGLVIAAGVAAVVLTGVFLGSPARTAAASGMAPPVPADLLGPVVKHPVGPGLAIAGGVLVAVAGLLVTAGRTGRRMGARYDAPTGRRSARSAAPGATAAVDPADPAALWKALDAGQDPTAVPPPAAGRLP